MTTRKELRDTIRDAIDGSSPALSAFSGNSLAFAADIMPAAYVQIASGSYEHDMSGAVALNRCDIAITYMHNSDHDDLDTIADTANQALFADTAFRSVVESAQLTGYYYEDDLESGVTSIICELSVSHK